MKIVPPVVLVVALCISPFARADSFEMTGSFTCTETQSGPKLVVEKLPTPALINAALGATDSKSFALVYDSNSGGIDIVRRCDETMFLHLAEVGTRGTSFQLPTGADTRKYVATLEGDFQPWAGPTPITGTFICTLKGISQMGSDEFLTASGSCKGVALVPFRGVCSFQGKIGKVFKTGGQCPT